MTMNHKSKHIRFLVLSTVLLFMLCASVFSQGTDSRITAGKKEKLYAGVLLNALRTNITNESYSPATPISYENWTSISFALDVGYFFSKNIGISISPGYGSYGTELTMDSCSFKFQTTDTENESYEMRIKGKSVVETQDISVLSIPVCVIYRVPAGDKLGFFLKGGLSFDIPLSKEYNSTGTFTYDGYYPAYPVLIQNYLPYFPSNRNTTYTGELQINSLITSLLVKADVYYSINKNMQLSLGFHYSKSISNISAYTPDTSYRLTSEPDELNSIMSGCSSAGLQALGVSLGFKYYIK